MASSTVPPQKRNPDPPKPRNPRRDLWRLGCWGGAAALSLAAVALITQTEVGRARLRQAVIPMPELGQAVATAEVPPPSVDNKVEIRRLQDAVRTLTADRDRLAARLAGLERNLDDMTGSIKTVTDATAATQAATEAVKQKIGAPPVAPVTTVPVMNFPSIISMVAAPPPPPADSKPAASEPAKLALNEAVAAAPNPAPPPKALEKVMEVPMPPTRTASVASEPLHAAPAVTHEFGIEVAGAPNIEALREQWAAIKSNYGPLMVGLHPIVSPRRHRAGHADYRLVVGPLPNLGAAAGICARFTAAGAFCQPAKFTGELLR